MIYFRETYTRVPGDRHSIAWNTERLQNTWMSIRGEMPDTISCSSENGLDLYTSVHNRPEKHIKRKIMLLEWYLQRRSININFENTKWHFFQGHISFLMWYFHISIIYFDHMHPFTVLSPSFFFTFLMFHSILIYMCIMYFAHIHPPSISPFVLLLPFSSLHTQTPLYIHHFTLF